MEIFAEILLALFGIITVISLMVFTLFLHFAGYPILAVLSFGTGVGTFITLELFQVGK
jgi:hypothetical protein